jgi:hypothetical protein
VAPREAPPTATCPTHGDLLAIGEQIGLSAGEMEQAARDVRQASLDAEARKRLLAGRKRWLAVHAALFAVINGLLFAVNALTTPGEWWVLFSVVFWGLALGLHAGVALGTGLSQSRLRRERALLEGQRNSALGKLRVAATPEQVTEGEQPSLSHQGEQSSVGRQR